jgi:hypothetical protein
MHENQVDMHAAAGIREVMSGKCQGSREKAKSRNSREIAMGTQLAVHN